MLGRFLRGFNSTPNPPRVTHSINPFTGMKIVDGQSQATMTMHMTDADKHYIDMHNANPRPILPPSFFENMGEENDGLLPEVVDPSFSAKLWHKTKDFVGAEGVSWVLTGAGTVGMKAVMETPAFVDFSTSEPFLSGAIVMATGLVTEKIGLAIYEGAKEAFWPSNRNLPYGKRVRKAWNGFLDKLKTDVIFHDIMSYTPLYALLSNSVDWSEGYISTAAFWGGVMIAPLWEQLIGEGIYKGAKHLVQKKDADVEKYYESRFVLTPKSHPQEILEDLSSRFGLTNRTDNIYYDDYISNRIPVIADREFAARERGIFGLDGGFAHHHTFEIYTAVPKAIEVGAYTLYEIEKEKAVFAMDGTRDIMKFASGLMARVLFDPFKGENVIFRRKVAFNDKLRVAIDLVYASENEAYYTLEFKAYDNPESRAKLHEALSYFVAMYPEQATVRSKAELVAHVRAE